MRKITKSVYEFWLKKELELERELKNEEIAEEDYIKEIKGIKELLDEYEEENRKKPKTTIKEIKGGYVKETNTIHFPISRYSILCETCNFKIEKVTTKGEKFICCDIYNLNFICLYEEKIK